MNSSKIRENARKLLKGKWGKAVLIVLAYLAFYFVFGYVDGVLGEPEFMDLVSLIIDVPISFGLTYAFISLIKNEEIKAFDFLKLGFSNFGRAWKISLRTALKLIIPAIILIVSILIITVSVSASIVGLAAGKTLDITAMLIIGGCLMLVSSIWLFTKGLLYSLTLYIAYDNPNMSSSEIVNESERLMKGNRVKLFLLELSFIGWTILAVFTFYIGCLWLIPYMQVASICFYEYLTGKNNNDNTDLS